MLFVAFWYLTYADCELVLKRILITVSNYPCAELDKDKIKSRNSVGYIESPK
jgi:hypothetical protein